jgi:hypothetical protein
LQYHEYDFVDGNGLHDYNFKKAVQNSKNNIVVIDGLTNMTNPINVEGKIVVAISGN